MSANGELLAPRLLLEDCFNARGGKTELHELEYRFDGGLAPANHPAMKAVVAPWAECIGTLARPLRPTLMYIRPFHAASHHWWITPKDRERYGSCSVPAMRIFFVACLGKILSLPGEKLPRYAPSVVAIRFDFGEPLVRASAYLYSPPIYMYLDIRDAFERLMRAAPKFFYGTAVFKMEFEYTTCSAHERLACLKALREIELAETS